MKVFAGYAMGEYANQSASGGIATAIGLYTISKGGVVAGAKYTQDWYDAEYSMAASEEDLCAF